MLAVFEPIDWAAQCFSRPLWCFVHHKMDTGMSTLRVAVIGGGAAGFFAALAAKERHPAAQVTLYEKSSKLLAKVKISGGGRCNVTNGCTVLRNLVKAYPRGQKLLKKAFCHFQTSDTQAWFEQRGVPLMTQADNCVFPVSQDSQSIIDCFLQEAGRLGVAIATRHGVRRLERQADGWCLHFQRDVAPPVVVDRVIVATGGSPKLQGLQWLAELGHRVAPPVPSLFTFNMPDEPEVRQLMGIVVEPVLTRLQGAPWQGNGPLLITHWGMSGPAVLQLSAFGARWLAERGYQATLEVSWANETNQEKVRDALLHLAQAQASKQLSNYRPYALPDRLWQYLLQKSGLPKEKRWSELGKKGLHKLTALLTGDTYQMRGKTTFKEEFVTCGGVDLADVNAKTLESKVCSGLYFAGEVLDIDGITGGYNFQAAWTTAYIAGQLGAKL